MSEPDNASFEIRGEVKKVDEDQRLVFGWAYVPDAHNRDHSGEYAPIEEVEKAAYPYVMSSRDASEQHVVKGVGTLIESVVFTPEKVEKMGLPPDALPHGWWVGFKLSPESFAKVKNGDYPMFSIGGKGKRKVVGDTVAKAEAELASAESLDDLSDIGKAYLSLLGAKVESIGDYSYYEAEKDEVAKEQIPRDHGPSIKCPSIYQALREKGKSKKNAAQISNACHQHPNCHCE